jgi:ribonuclease D
MPSQEQYKAVSDIPSDLLKKYLGEKLIAVDSELQGLQLWRDQVCLIQLCDEKGNLCLVRIKPPRVPPNLKKLFTAPATTKVFHYALTDVAFLRASLKVAVHPYRCTKVMSKLVRTYSESHSLKILVHELCGADLDKGEQATDWSRPDLSPAQLRYAAGDVIYLLQIYKTLEKMINQRGRLPTGITAKELNERSQACLPTMVEIVLNGYGDRDRGWETSLFAH